MTLYFILKEVVSQTDKGIIQSLDGTVNFKVEFVANHPGNHNLVCHFGSYSGSASLNIGDIVKQMVNKDDCELFAR